MKKICYIVTISATIKAFFVKQLQYLANNGYDVTVICSNDDKLKNILGDNIRYIPLDMPRGISIIGSIKSIRKLKKIFKEENFDLIQYSTPNAALYSSIAGRNSKIKIRNYHLMGLRFEGANGLLRMVLKSIEKITCKYSTHIECVSNSGLETSLNYNLFPKEKGTVIWNGSSGGIDLDKYNVSYKGKWNQEVRKKHNLPMESIVYGFVGRITIDKGINELLEAFKILESKQDNVYLLLTGNFEKRESLDIELLHWAESSANVIFVDWAKDIEKYYAAIDVLVLPSYREGFGNVVIEAEAMGTPVIVSNIPGPTGLTVKVKNPDSVYEAMNTLLDKSLRDKFSGKATAFVKENFDSDILCKHILDRKQMLLK